MKLLSHAFRLLLVQAIILASLSAQNTDIDSIRRKAQTGDAKAEFDLANAYWQGNGIQKDPAQGLDWLRKSASQGYAGAEVTLGVLYQRGVQVSQDPHEAAKWFRKAALQAKTDPKHAQNAQKDLADLAAQGVISMSEADWRSSEPGSKPPSSGNTSGKNDKALAFSLAEVDQGLTGGITPKRMATLVTQYGVDFTLSSSAKKKLTVDGADDALLQVIASAKR